MTSKKLLRISLLVAWLCLTVFLSLQVGDSSSRLSNWIALRMVNFFGLSVRMDVFHATAEEIDNIKSRLDVQGVDIIYEDERGSNCLRSDLFCGCAVRWSNAGASKWSNLRNAGLGVKSSGCRNRLISRSADVVRSIKLPLGFRAAFSW